MALVKYGAGVVQISGSIAGDVHARNRFGNYIRPRTKPVNPHSERQEAARANISFIAELWHDAQMDAHREGWNTYAAGVGMKNRLGETIHLTGFNHFIRTNGALINWSGNVILPAPSTVSLPEKDTDLVCASDDVTNQQFTFTCNQQGWLPDTDRKSRIILFQGQPQLASRNYFDGHWRYMGVIDAGEGAAGKSVQDKAFQFSLGQKVWFKARILTNQGRLSEPWQLAPKTIADDTGP